MKVVGLLSGGKDSCYNLCHCVNQGHEVVALATLAPPQGTDELDSYMYQTVGHDAVHLVAEAMQLPLYRQVIKGKPVQTDQSFGVLRTPKGEGESSSSSSSSSSHSTIEQDETEDLHLLLQQVKKHHPDVEGVSVGAILSNYQRFRVETICARWDLQLQPLAYLWQRNQSELLAEMVQAGVEAVLIKCAGIGLDRRDLGKTLSNLQPKLEKLKGLYGAHVCGEGGEYETLTLDCPLFRKRIDLVETQTIVDSSTSFASVAYLRIHKARLVDKELGTSTLNDVSRPATLDKLGLRTERAVQTALQTGESSCNRKNSHFVKLPKLTCRNSLPREAMSRRKGNWVAFSGIVADVKEEGSSSDSSTEPSNETYQTFAGLRRVLNRHQLDLPHVQHLNLTLRDQALFAETNKVYKQHFQIEPPSRATIALPHLRTRGNDSKGRIRGTTVELDGWAYDDGSSYTPEASEAHLSHFHPSSASPRPPTLQQNHPGSRSARQALHVQSLSYWASANIGPYSQGLINASRMSIAGQIGLLPVDLSLPESIERQYALSLQHARRIFQAMLEERSRADKGWVEGGICWIARMKSDPIRGVHDTTRLRAALQGWGAQDGASYAQNTVRSEARRSSQTGEEGEAATEAEEEPDWLFGSDGIINRSQDAGAHALPMMYAHLGPKDLPRGAAVEWQLTAHDGRRQRRRGPQAQGVEGRTTEETAYCDGDDDDDDDDDEFESEEADRPVARHDSLLLPISTLPQHLRTFSSSFSWPSSSEPSSPETHLEISHQYISSPSGASSFGIVALRFLSMPRSEAAGESRGDDPAGERVLDEEALQEVRKRLRGALSIKLLVSIGPDDDDDDDDDEGQDVDASVDRMSQAVASLTEDRITGRMDGSLGLLACFLDPDLPRREAIDGDVEGPTTATVTATLTRACPPRPPACSVASALRLSTVRRRRRRSRTWQGEEAEEGWDDWQLAFVWHDVE